MAAVVLLSSGLDSTVNLYQARAQGEVRLALTFDYGQRAAAKEVSASAQICSSLGVPHRVVPLAFFQEFGTSSLLDRQQHLPQKQEIQMDDLEASRQSAKAVWVPNRNGIFLNIAAGFAEALKAEVVIPGFNIEEAATFPDNSLEFLQRMSQSLKLSTATGVRAECATVNLNKTEMVKLGEKLGVNWSQIWPCYQDFEKWCGQCESCQRARRAFVAANLKGVFDANAMA